MHALIVVSHPNQQSFTHAVAARVAQGIAASNHSFEVADLAAEGFSPGFTRDDISFYLRESAPPADVITEHARLDRADALVLVYPIYWWSFPALLKGWIDRVFTNGWAYEEDSDGKLVKKLGHLQVHQLAIGAADMGTFARHGYLDAMKTQINHGIFEYCGARVVPSEPLLLADAQFPDAHLETAFTTGRDLFVEPVQ